MCDLLRQQILENITYILNNSLLDYKENIPITFNPKLTKLQDSLLPPSEFKDYNLEFLEL